MPARRIPDRPGALVPRKETMMTDKSKQDVQDIRDVAEAEDAAGVVDQQTANEAATADGNDDAAAKKGDGGAG
jgi:hypothetical protein